MKHLKRFNEELYTQTYIRAGKSLKYDGKKKSGSKLIDYGYEKGIGAHGFYTAHIQYGSQQAVYNGKITNPICNFYYGIPEWDGPQSNVNSKLIYDLR